jgi:hypothetical protein
MHVGCIHEERVDAVLVRSADHVEAVVDSGHRRSALGDLSRQPAIAAAHIEDAFPRLRVEKIERRRPQLGDECADPGVIGRVPAAGRGGNFAQSVFTQSR